MKKVKCEYCGRPTFIDDLECFRCGAPLPLMEEQLKPKPVVRGGLYTTASTNYYYGQTLTTTFDNSLDITNGIYG